MASEEQHNQSIKDASADNVDTKNEGSFGQPGLLNPERSGSTGRTDSNAVLAKAQKLRGSRASVAEPSKPRIFNPHATNPGRIPTAGGVAVGSRPYEQRRQSRVSTDMGSSQASGALVDKDGSPDQLTESNTQGNVIPSSANGEGSSKEAPPMFKESLFEDKDTSAGAEKNDSAAPSTGTPSTTTEKVKENLPTGSSSSPPTKERRGSTMEKLKGKLGLGKN